MYVPEHFSVSETDVLHRHIRDFGFATLISTVADAPFATHLPLVLDATRGPHGTLLGHMARPNPQWQGFDGAQEVLAIFHGPHAYVSPSWYPAENAVPTWNYAVVHVYGTARLIEDPETVRAMMEGLVSDFEAGRPAPWSMDLPRPKFIEGMLKGIAAFEIPISRIEGKFKLNQNHPEANRTGAIAGLREESHPDAALIADMMEAALKSG